MKIGLFFGSFNPIHIGHLIIASYVINNTDMDQIWFVLSPQNPFKPSRSLLNEYDRLSLVDLAIADNPAFRTCDIEFKLPKPSYTINSMAYLEEKYPEHRFSIIVGSDSYQNLPKWKNADALIRNNSFIVYLRQGFEVEPSAQTTVLKAPLLEISATEIRNAIKARKSVRYLLPDKVIAEIEKAGYYSR